jgi:outer membrane protein assembly factor BamB
VRTKKLKEEKKMKFSITRTKTATIASLLTLTIAATFMVCLPAVYAAEIQTTAYISVSPNPIGVNQSLLVNVWLVPSIPTLQYYHGYVVKFTKPDGTIDTIGPFNSEFGGTGANSFTYVPDKVGTWYYQFSYPGGDVIAGNNYLPSTSPKSELIVQKEPIPQWPPAEFPTSFTYWGRPINAENRDWYMLGGDWPQSGYNASMAYFNPYSTGPNTSHILWARQTGVAGLIGGKYGNTSYAGGSSVSILLAGLAYYTASDGMHCIDVHTGEELWVKPGISPSIGVAAPQHLYTAGSSLVAELWQVGANYVKYNPFTGIATLTVPGALSGTYVEPYFYSYTGGRLITWKTDKRVMDVNASLGVINSFKELIVSNVSCNYGFNLVWQDVGVAINRWPDESAAINLTTGKTLWNMTLPREENPVGASCVADGRIYVAGQGMVFRAYDLYMGRKLWTSEPAAYPWGAFWANSSAAAYGNLYGLSYDGHVYCYNASTGKIKWKFYSGNSYGETRYNTWAFSTSPVVAEGKIYASTGEYTPPEPSPRGNRLYCINATTGERIWSIDFAGGTKVVGEGMLLATNEYNGLLYCFGRGPTSVQVSTSPTKVVNGSSVFIEGYVLDQSPGQPGTPCVSAKNMSRWMEFLHMQAPCPTTVMGVPLELRALTSSGSRIEIGFVTTDLYGHFSCVWTPPASDRYTIVARFYGDDSYFSSWKGTGLSVEAAQPTPTPPTEASAPDYTPMFAGIIVAIAVSIIIGIYSIYDHRKLRK